MKTQKSDLEIIMGGRYSVRKPGETAYATTSNLLVAQKLCREANRLMGSQYSQYKLVDNRHEAFLAVHARDNKHGLL